MVRQENYSTAELLNRVQNFYSGNLLDSSVEEKYTANRIIHSYFAYDKRGNLLTKQEVITPGDDVGWRYLYNDSNQLITTYQKIGDQKEGLYASYVYYSNRMVKQIRHYDAKGKEDFSYLYTYKNENDSLIVTRFARLLGGTSSVDYVRKYNGKSQLIEQETYVEGKGINSNGDFSSRMWRMKEVFEYFPNRLLKEKIAEQDGKLFRSERHVYH